MRDPRAPGQIVLMLGVLLVALPSAIGFVGGVQVDTMVNLVLSLAGVVLTVIGMVMVYRAGRPAA
jgi:hypothetical protein